MTTPAPGDLSARHVEVLREFVGRYAGQIDNRGEYNSGLFTRVLEAIAALSALPAAGGAVAYGWLIENGKQVPNLRYRAFDSLGLPYWTADHNEAIHLCRREDAERLAAADEDAWCIVEHGRHPTPPIAALSALPAAGGDEPVGTVMSVTVDEYGEDLAHIGWHRPVPLVGTKLYTTPQPSAAEPKCGCGRPGEYESKDGPACNKYFRCKDAAVGAQGEAEELARWLDAKYSRHREDEDRRAAALIRRLAAPAAVKGVDASAALAEFTRYFVKNYPGPDTILHDPNWHAPRIFRAAQAALTRQPVAGDGWRPIESAPKDGTLVRLLIAADDVREHPLDDSAEATQTIGHNNFDNDGEDRWQFAGWCWSHDHYVEGHGNPIAWATLPALAAPAATPTDGGEGKNA